MLIRRSQRSQTHIMLTRLPQALPLSSNRTALDSGNHGVRIQYKYGKQYEKVENGKMFTCPCVDENGVCLIWENQENIEEVPAMCIREFPPYDEPLVLVGDLPVGELPVDGLPDHNKN